MATLNQLHGLPRMADLLCKLWRVVGKGLQAGGDPSLLAATWNPGVVCHRVRHAANLALRVHAAHLGGGGGLGGGGLGGGGL